MPIIQERPLDLIVHSSSVTVIVEVPTRPARRELPTPLSLPGATHVRRIPQTITETITTDLASSTNATSGRSSTASNVSIPIPAIAGGAVAGAVVAITLAILWKLWTKWASRDREKYRRRFDNGMEIRVDERRFTHPPIRSPIKASRRVQFHDIQPVTEDDASFDEEKDHSPFARRVFVPSAPQPLRPSASFPKKGAFSHSHVRTSSASNNPFVTPPRPTLGLPAYSSNPPLLAIPEPVVASPPVSPVRGTEPSSDALNAPIPRTLLPLDTASTTESVSFYSVQSAESRRPPVFPRSLLATALGLGGDTRQDALARRTSVITKDSMSVYSEPEQLSTWRHAPHILGRTVTKTSRLSTVSSIMPSHQRLSAVGAPIGLATSGEDEEELLEYGRY